MKLSCLFEHSRLFYAHLSLRCINLSMLTEIFHSVTVTQNRHGIIHI